MNFGEGLIIGLMFGIAITFVLTTNQVSDNWQTSIVERGCGQYNSKTSDFEWTEPAQ